MATWKKVIVSGSSAELAALKVDNLTSGQVVIGGGSAGNLSTTAINGTGNIVATTNATGLVHSGSFSGSFAGLATNATSASFASTSSLPLLGIVTASVSVSTITFTKGDSSTFQVTISQSGSAASANAIVMNNTAAGVYYPTFAISGSGSQSLYVNSSSFSYNAATNTLSATASFATTSSYITSSAVYGPYGLNSILSASYASGSTSASFATTASYALNITPIATGSFATTGSNTFIGTETISGSINITGSASLTGSFNILGTISASAFSGSHFGTSSWAVSASNAVSSAFASTAASATQVANALTFGVGVSGSAASYNGSAAVTVHVSGAATLITGNHPKWSGTGFTNSLISDNGTTVTIASGSTITAGGLTVTGNSTFNNNLTVTGDLSVAGTASFTNTDNLNVRDKFILINSGSSVLADSGWVTQYNVAGSGSAFYLEAGATNDHGPYGRFAVAFDVIGTSNSLTPSEYVVTAKINQASNPTNTVPPTWGTGSNGSGNMWITNAGDIYIYG
jgi:hypothetical protein